MSDWPQADSDKVAAHNLKMNALHDDVKAIEDRLSEDFAYLKSQEWKVAFHAWRAMYNACRQCGSEDTRVENHSMMWHDGDIVCNDCGRYVRMFDAG